MTVNSGNTLAIATNASNTPSSANFIVDGTLELQSGGSVSTAPTYGSSSILKYNTGGGTTPVPGSEWTPNTTSGAGCPQNIVVAS